MTKLFTMICHQFAYAHLHQGFDCGDSCFYYHISLEHLCPVTTCSCSKDRLCVLLTDWQTDTHNAMNGGFLFLFIFIFLPSSVLRQQQLL